MDGSKNLQKYAMPKTTGPIGQREICRATFSGKPVCFCLPTSSFAVERCTMVSVIRLHPVNMLSLAVAVCPCRWAVYYTYRPFGMLCQSEI